VVLRFDHGEGYFCLIKKMVSCPEKGLVESIIKVKEMVAHGSKMEGGSSYFVLPFKKKE
jgi:hypothetical protein